MPSLTGENKQNWSGMWLMCVCQREREFQFGPKAVHLPLPTTRFPLIYSKASFTSLERGPTSPLTVLNMKAREEAQAAMDTVEGFAKLNRKLVDELR